MGILLHSGYASTACIHELETNTLCGTLTGGRSTSDDSSTRWSFLVFCLLCFSHSLDKSI